MAAAIAAAVSPAPVAAPVVTHPNSSLYVGDLGSSVEERDLYDVFNDVAQVVSIRVCRDQFRRSLGYAYVNFGNPIDAARAMKHLNFTVVKGKPIRIMISNRDPSTRLSGKGNVFIKNLDLSIDNRALYETFYSFGNILSCKLSVDGNGRSKGYGYVQFEHEEAAQNAIEKLNGMLINDKQVFVGFFVSRHERARSSASPEFTNVYVKNLPKDITDDELRKTFEKYGTITSAMVVKDQNGNSKCFGFVNFESPEAAASAVEKMNGISLGDDNVLYVGRAQKRSERESELRTKFEQERISRYEKLQGANLYLKNLDDTIDDEKLKDLFSEFGTIKSCKVMVNPQGVSKGSGFVAFSTPEEASRALNEMNGKMIGRKPLYVAVAQRKEDRRTHLQALFAQSRAPGVMPPLASGIPGFHHPGAPMTGPRQIYLGPNSPGLMPSQPVGYGFPPQFLPGMRPSAGPNFLIPYPFQRQAQPGQRLGFRHGGDFQQMQSQQLLHRNPNQGFRYTGNGRNGMDPTVVPHGILPPIVPLPLDASAMPVSPHYVQQKGPLPISKLTSALTSASPNDRTRILGEQLYPLVERHEPVHVAKVTGMLLEMDQAEILHLIESPDALKEKVAEAMEVLRRSAEAGSNVDDQLGFSNTE